MQISSDCDLETDKELYEAIIVQNLCTVLYFEVKSHIVHEMKPKQQNQPILNVLFCDVSKVNTFAYINS